MTFRRHPHVTELRERRLPESNRCKRLCRPVRLRMFSLPNRDFQFQRAPLRVIDPSISTGRHLPRRHAARSGGVAVGSSSRGGRITQGAEHFRDLYAWDAFWP